MSFNVSAVGAGVLQKLSAMSPTARAVTAVAGVAGAGALYCAAEELFDTDDRYGDHPAIGDGIGPEPANVAKRFRDNAIGGPRKPHVRIGMVAGGRAQGQDHGARIAELERMTGQKMAMTRKFIDFDQQLPTKTMIEDKLAGRVPFITWTATEDGTDPIPFAEIAHTDKYDDWIRSNAQALREFGSPVVFNFHHEPEGDPNGNAEEFKAAFRKVETILDEEGADNVKVAAVFQGASYTNGRIEDFYPGDDAVDYVTSNGFNKVPQKIQGTDPPSDSWWRSFEEIFTPARDFAQAHDKPFLIGAYGSLEDPNQPGRKAQWLQDAARTAQKWPDLHAMVYFNGHDKYPYPIDTSPSALESYRNVVSHPYFSAKGMPPAR